MGAELEIKTPLNSQEKAAKVALGTVLRQTFDVESKVFEGLKGTVEVSLPDCRGVLQMGIVSARLRTDKQTGRVVPIEDMDAQSAGMVMMLSTLTVAVTKAPEWWYEVLGTGLEKKYLPAPEKIQDSDLISDLFERYANWRASFRITG